MDHHTVASVAIAGSCLDVLGSLYLAYDLLGGPHGPLRLLTRAVTYSILFGLGYGLGLGLIAARFIEALLYQVKPSDPRMVAIPWLVLLATALFATIPAAVRAIRTDLATTLRTE